MDAATISDIVMASVLGLLGVDRGRQIYTRRRNGNDSDASSLVTREHCRDEHKRLEKDAAKREKWEEDVSGKLSKIATDVAVLVALYGNKHNEGGER